MPAVWEGLQNLTVKETAFAKQLRTEHGLTLGIFGNRAFAPNGQSYICLTGAGGEDEAAAAFALYCVGRTGLLHWRIMPEITSLPHGKQTFYMRLLIEDRP
jgi:hypothetical protein